MLLYDISLANKLAIATATEAIQLIRSKTKRTFHLILRFLSCMKLTCHRNTSNWFYII